MNKAQGQGRGKQERRQDMRQPGQAGKPAQGQPVKPVSKRKELREAQRATLGAYCRFDKGTDPFEGESYKRWSKLTATERDYLGTVLSYTTLTSLHSLEARLEEVREEVRAGAERLKGVPGALTELKLVAKTLDVLSEDVGFLADAAESAGYGQSGGGEDEDEAEVEDGAEGDNEEDDEAPPYPDDGQGDDGQDDMQDGDVQDDGQDGDGQDGDGQDGDGQDGDGQDGDGPQSELPSLDSLMAAPPVMDAEVEEVPPPKKERRNRQQRSEVEPEPQPKQRNRQQRSA